MGNTNIRSRQIKDADILKADINTTTTGSALITKVVSGTGISLSSSGVDAGTGDVTVALASGVATAGTYDTVTVDTYGRVTSGVVDDKFHKSLSIISPTNTDKVGIFYMSVSNTYSFTGGLYFVRGTSPSISFTVYYSTTRTGSLTTLASVTSGTSTAGTTFGTSSSALGNVYIWVEVTAVSGTVDELWLQLNFSK